MGHDVLDAQRSDDREATVAVPHWFLVWRCISVAVLAAVLLVTAIAAWAGVPSSGNAAALRAQYALMQDRLIANEFAQPLVLESQETAHRGQGDIHALVDFPFAIVASTLREARRWCDILSLHLNVKYCRAEAGDTSGALAVELGRKYPESLDPRRRVIFSQEVLAETADYFATRLTAESGPYHTSDYAIMLEAIPMPHGRSFLHLSFAYGFDARSALAMRAYLATAGSGKIGFTVVGTLPDGAPAYVGDMRGLLERNAMRYYLAINTNLDSLSSPPPERLERRLHEWYAATERYSLQLHELDEGSYLAMKRDEYERQQNQD